MIRNTEPFQHLIRELSSASGKEDWNEQEWIRSGIGKWVGFNLQQAFSGNRHRLIRQLDIDRLFSKGSPEKMWWPSSNVPPLTYNSVFFLPLQQHRPAWIAWSAYKWRWRKKISSLLHGTNLPISAWMKFWIVVGAFFWVRERMSLFYLFQTVIYFQLKRKLKQINLVKQIIFYYLCSYLCTQIYNQKGKFYVLIRIIQLLVMELVLVLLVLTKLVLVLILDLK